MTAISTIAEMCRPHWDETASRRPVARLWRKDHTLWKPDPNEITNRLGWLDLPHSMRSAIPELTRFGQSLHDRDIKHVVVLGMGGSSLCAEVLRQTFPSMPGYPRLIVLDSTIPSVLTHVLDQIDPAQTLFIVASKSGTTIEALSLYEYFREIVAAARGRNAGDNFVAITDPGTPLLHLANTNGFLRTFINPADVGGRYSALSYFGLVPAAALGLNIGELLMRARATARACGVTAPPEKNPGARLGLCMGCLARHGRDKLTIITSPGVAAFALWAEQLIAESTGKDGTGIIPIAGEPLAAPDAYGDDRQFVYLRLADDDNSQPDRHVEALDNAGMPVIGIDLRDRHDIIGEFFRWEFAVAIAGAILDVNPFDQPDVQQSKTIAGEILAAVASGKPLTPPANHGAFRELIASARPGDYIAFLIFAAQTAELDAALQSLRRTLLTRYRLPSSVGYGPGFLHSTGQLHKGGGNNGLFVQLYAENGAAAPIPGKPYDFHTLATAQAIGDFNALKARGRRLARICVKEQAHLPNIVTALAHDIPSPPTHA